MSDELREAIKAGVRKSVGYWRELDEPERTLEFLQRDVTHCILDAIKAAGWVVVPRKLTPPMVETLGMGISSNERGWNDLLMAFEHPETD